MMRVLLTALSLALSVGSTFAAPNGVGGLAGTIDNSAQAASLQVSAPSQGRGVVYAGSAVATRRVRLADPLPPTWRSRVRASSRAVGCSAPCSRVVHLPQRRDGTGALVHGESSGPLSTRPLGLKHPVSPLTRFYNARPTAITSSPRTVRGRPCRCSGTALPSPGCVSKSATRTSACRRNGAAATTLPVSCTRALSTSEARSPGPVRRLFSLACASLEPFR